MLGDSLYLDNIREYVEDQKIIVSKGRWGSHLIHTSRDLSAGYLQMAQQRVGCSSECCKAV